MNVKRIITAPARGVKSLTQMVFSRSTWSAWMLPQSVRVLQELEDGTKASTIMAPLLWLCRTFPEAPIRVAAIDPETGSTEPIPTHDLPKLIRRPNPYYTRITLWMAVIIDLLVNGNAYLLKIRNEAGEVKELWWAPASTMTAQGDASNFISHYDYSPNGLPIRLESDDVIHFRYGMDPANPRTGLSPLKSVLKEVMTDEDAAQFTNSLLANMGVPGLVVSPEVGQAPPGDDDVAATKTYIRDNFTGDKRGQPLVMSGATKVEQFGFSPEQLNLRELRRIPEERVTAVLGVPAIVAGLGAGLDRSTFANMSEAREMAYESGVMPLQRLICEELGTQLLPDFHRGENTDMLEVEFDTSKIRVLQEDEGKKIERLNVAVVGGWLPVAYAQREGFGIDPTEYDDVYLRGLNIEAVPVGEDPAPADVPPVTPPPVPPDPTPPTPPPANDPNADPAQPPEGQ